jgi:1-deoxy-D-xylulose-5-phosphate reductoisomerase
MVEYIDGSILAQVSATDMRMPIQYALSYPAREPAPVPRLDWSVARHWDFAPPDLERFQLLKLAYQAQASGGSATCTLNAADEIAVSAFLTGQVSFPGIAQVVEETLCRVAVRHPKSIAEVLEIDEESRAVARELVNSRAGVEAGCLPKV